MLLEYIEYLMVYFCTGLKESKSSPGEVKVNWGTPHMFVTYNYYVCENFVLFGITNKHDYIVQISTAYAFGQFEF